MWSAVSNSAYQGKLVRLVHAGTDAESFIAANLRRLRWLVGWISDVERQLPGAHSGNSGGRFRCRPARRYSQGKSRLGAAIRRQTLSHWAHSSWRRLDFITERTSLPKFRSFWRFS